MSLNSRYDSSSKGTFVVRIDEAGQVDEAQSKSEHAIIKILEESEAQRKMLYGTVTYVLRKKVRNLLRIPTGFRLKGSKDKLTKLYENLSKYRSTDSLGRTEMIVYHKIQKRYAKFRFRRLFDDKELKSDEDYKLSTLRDNYKDFKNAGHRRRIPSVWLKPEELCASAALGEEQGKAFKKVGLEVQSIDIVMTRAIPASQAYDKTIDARNLHTTQQDVEYSEDDYVENGSVVFNGRFLRTESDSDSDYDSDSDTEAASTSLQPEGNESEDFEISQDELDLIVESLEHYFVETNTEVVSTGLQTEGNESDATESTAIGTNGSPPLSETHAITSITSAPSTDESTPLVRTAQKTNSFASGLFGFLSRITHAVISVANFFFAPLAKLASFIR